MNIMQLSPHVRLIRGGTNSIALVFGTKALLFDCGEEIPGYLKEMNISPEAVICTSYRRTRLSGIYAYPKVTIYAPEKEAHLIENPEAFWADEKYRWHLYSFMPDTDVLPISAGKVIPINENWKLIWNEITITAIPSSVNTYGEFSYRFNVDNIEWGVCGDTIYSKGRIYEIYSMQGNEDDRRGYHGFLASRTKLFSCMEKLAECDCLIPSHGDIIKNPTQELSLLKDRLEELYDNFASISCLNYYFNNYPLTTHMKNPYLMTPCQTLTPPSWMSFVDCTTNIIIAEDKSAFVIDCGHINVIKKLENLILEGRIKSIDACFITHSHDDHVDAVSLLKERFGCEVYVIDIMQDITENPERYFAPCLSPCAVKVTSIPDNTEMQWKEFKLKFYRLPGQTLYHGGMTAEGYGEKIMFAGDSGGPSGIDDYCCQNRCFSGENRGSMRAFDIIEQEKVDYIINQHQRMAFKFTHKELDFMRGVLRQREKILSELLPWAAPDFGTDSSWARAYPYEQICNAGEQITISCEFTNHSYNKTEIEIEPILPTGFELSDKSPKNLILPPRTCGFAYEFSDYPDLKAEFTIKLSDSLKPGLYIIPYKITFNGQSLGWFRQTIVKVRS